MSHALNYNVLQGWERGFDVKLTNDPGEDAVVYAQIARNRNVASEPNSLLFTRDTWDEAQTITVTAEGRRHG